uniref:Uncharacterized protein MANES_06G037000 n=1 Tax=Rhizophora mucronata TaxID=61149 RepID=A0A2P2JK55_RHIMU
MTKTAGEVRCRFHSPILSSPPLVKNLLILYWNLGFWCTVFF